LAAMPRSAKYRLSISPKQQSLQKLKQEVLHKKETQLSSVYKKNTVSRKQPKTQKGKSTNKKSREE